MPRPRISLDTTRRLHRVARDITDDVNMSHEEAITVVLDHIENLEEQQAENFEQLKEELSSNQPRQQQGISSFRRDRGGGWTG